MDINQLLRMAGKMLFRKFMGTAMNKGLDLALGAEKPKDEMTREDRIKRRSAKDQARRMRDTMKAGRKLW